jgi:hypothetical protein
MKCHDWRGYMSPHEKTAERKRGWFGVGEAAK